MTDDRQQIADQKFFEQTRKLSPRFPDASTFAERRRDRQERVAARTLLWGFVPFGLATAYWDSFGWGVAGVGLLGFISLCFIGGARMAKKSGGQGGRPF